MPDSLELRESRLLVLAPTAEDAALSINIIGGAGLRCITCRDVDELARELERGAGAILLTEGILTLGDPDRIIRIIRTQPEWSDIPVLLLAGGGTEAPAATWLMESLGNVTVLDRPVRIITLISAIRSATKARQRQYQVRDQVQTIERAREALEQEAQRKDEFLATLAHELRNPLAPISNSLRLMQHHAATPDQVQYAIEMMTRQVTHMVRLVDDLMDLSRITRGVVELRLESVDVTTAMRAAIDASRPNLESKQHELILDMATDGLSIEADAVRLTQIVTNLLNNAAKYTEPGGVITLRSCVVRDANHAEWLEIRVSDTGIGIPPEMLRRVFDMFTQVDHSQQLAHGGLGIGLTLVNSLIALHGGSVEARSEGVGKGSEFVVRLPARHVANNESRRLAGLGPTARLNTRPVHLMGST
jgi:signal transduction histidine kinase